MATCSTSKTKDGGGAIIHNVREGMTASKTKDESIGLGDIYNASLVVTRADCTQTDVEEEHYRTLSCTIQSSHVDVLRGSFKINSNQFSLYRASSYVSHR